MLREGDVVDGRYQVEALVGRGGLAEVYRVRHVDLGSLHALKVLVWRRKSLIERLVLEGRIQAQLRHPNIVAVTDLVRLDDQVGLLMEYIEHETLESYLERKGKLTLEESLSLMAPVLSAVTAAHDAGVLHRDLKPANIMLSISTQGIVPKVADFGIAKVVVEDIERSGSTAAGVTMGTPGYLPPEQILDSAETDARADIFALGAILYECIAGSRAFADAEGHVDVRSTLDISPVPLLTLGLCGSAVCDAVGKALAKDRDERFLDIRSFAKALYVDHPELYMQVEGQRVSRPLDLDAKRAVSSLGGPRTGSVTTGERGTPALGATIMPDSAGSPATWSDVPATQTVIVERGGPGWAIWVALAGVGGVAVLALVAVALVASGIFVSAPTVVGAPEPRGSISVEQGREPEPAGVGQDGRALAGQASAADPLGTAVQPAPSAEVGTPRPDGGTADVAPAGPKPVSKEAPVPSPALSVAPKPDAVADPTIGVADVVPVPVPVPEAVPVTVPVPGAVTAPAPVEQPEGTAEPEARLSGLEGTWQGTAGGRPFTLRFMGMDGDEVMGEAIFVLGTTRRAAPVRGRYDQGSGAITLRDANGEFAYRGTVSGSALTGSYGKPGANKEQDFKVERR